MKNTILLYLTVGCITIFGCNTKHPDTKELDTVTTGTIAIDVDENYQPLLVAEIDVFDSLYPKAKILANYTSESVAVANLINDSVSAVVIGRKLKEKELDYFKKRGFTPKETLIAKDGLALIVHNNNRDTALTVEQVKQILSGKITKWKDINPKSVLGDIQVVFDNPNSCTVQYVLDSINGGQPLPKNTFATKTNPEVIAYIKQNANALGIIGVNWISDSDNPKAQKFLKNIKVVEVSKGADKEYFGPYQAYIATKDYPFIRSVYYYDAQGRPGLALGLASFIASDRGQRIILKDGLLPATMPIRLLKVTK